MTSPDKAKEAKAEVKRFLKRVAEREKAKSKYGPSHQ